MPVERLSITSGTELPAPLFVGILSSQSVAAIWYCDHVSPHRKQGDKGGKSWAKDQQEQSQAMSPCCTLKWRRELNPQSLLTFYVQPLYMDFAAF